MRTDVEPGKDVQVYARDKWQPAKLVELGRKWAKVTLNGKNYNTKVPVDAVRAMTREQAQNAHTKAPEVAQQPKQEGLCLVEEDHYLKIKRGGNTVAVFIKHYRKEAEAAFAAVKGLEQNG